MTIKIKIRGANEFPPIFPLFILFVVGGFVLLGQGWRFWIFYGSYMIIWFFTQFKFVTYKNKRKRK
ncbi:MAG: hypothetical protein AABY22_01530 [Nanoarchaeota archaeon]